MKGEYSQIGYSSQRSQCGKLKILKGTVVGICLLLKCRHVLPFFGVTLLCSSVSNRNLFSPGHPLNESVSVIFLFWIPNVVCSIFPASSSSSQILIKSCFNSWHSSWKVFCDILWNCLYHCLNWLAYSLHNISKIQRGTVWTGGGGPLPYMGYIGMYGPKR